MRDIERIGSCESGEEEAVGRQTRRRSVDEAGSDSEGPLLSTQPCAYIVAFYGAFSDHKAGTVSIVLEYMDAGSLQVRRSEEFTIQ
jgi:hypothetical protein